MGFVEWNCPRCGKKNREKCNAWVYGSPIRNCKECNAEYFDRRWREIALEGVEPASKNAKLYLENNPEIMEEIDKKVREHYKIS